MISKLSNQDRLIEMIRCNYPKLHRYAVLHEPEPDQRDTPQAQKRKIYYINAIAFVTKYPAVIDRDQLKILSIKNYRDLMKGLHKHIIDNDEVITFYEL